MYKPISIPQKLSCFVDEIVSYSTKNARVLYTCSN